MVSLWKKKTHVLLLVFSLFVDFTMNTATSSVKKQEYLEELMSSAHCEEDKPQRSALNSIHGIGNDTFDFSNSLFDLTFALQHTDQGWDSHTVAQIRRNVYAGSVRGSTNITYIDNYVRVSGLSSSNLTNKSCKFDAFEVTWKVTTDLVTVNNGIPYGLNWGFGLYQEDAHDMGYLERWKVWAEKSKSQTEEWEDFIQEYEKITGWANSSPVQSIGCKMRESEEEIVLMDSAGSTEQVNLLDDFSQFGSKPIYSEYDECNKPPQLTAMIATPGYEEGNTITVKFDRDTNMPTGDVSSIIRFSGGRIGTEFKGEWKNANTYVITITDATNHTDYHNSSHPIFAKLVSREPTPVEIFKREKQWYQRFLQEKQKRIKFLNPEPQSFTRDKVFPSNIDIDLDKRTITTKGRRQIRLGEEGTYNIRLFLLQPPNDVSNGTEAILLSNPFTVFNCDSPEPSGPSENSFPELIISNISGLDSKSQVKAFSESDPATKRVKPFWQLKGPIASSGKSELKLPSFRTTAVKSQDSKNQRSDYDTMWTPITSTILAPEWSLHMWIYLPDPDTITSGSGSLSETLSNNVKEKKNKYRALLYHGLGSGHESGGRTPSVWLCPNSNRISLRVSTASSFDFGVDSEEEIPTNQWVHLSFLFKNETASGSNYIYTAKVILNFETELVSFSTNQGEEVLPSTGYLYIGQDAWGSGPALLLKDIELFTTPHFEHLDSILNNRMEAASSLEDENFSSLEGITDVEDVLSPMNSMATVKDYELNDALYKEALESTEPQTILQKLDAAAMGGHVDSTYAIALINLFGPKAWKKLEKKNDLVQMVQDFEFETTPESSRKGLKLLQVAAMYGHSNALYLMGVFYEYGLVLKSDEKYSLAYLFQAALNGNERSLSSLGKYFNKYKNIEAKCETAAFFYSNLANIASNQYHTPGHEPLLEDQRLSTYLSKEGEGGDDDEAIQYQLLQARKGDIDAMYAMAGLYYWGARGVNRNQQLAFEYFSKAANKGHAGSMTACGNLLLKGEGVEKNTTKAMEWYRKAIETGNETSAMNGLGYIHYFGNEEVRPNVSKALEYFEMNGRDGDSLFNAAHIYLHGHKQEIIENEDKNPTTTKDEVENEDKNQYESSEMNQMATAYSDDKSSTNELSHTASHGVIEEGYGRHDAGHLDKLDQTGLPNEEKLPSANSDGHVSISKSVNKLENIGIKQNVGKAMELLKKASNVYGHFDSTKTLGDLYLYGPPAPSFAGDEENEIKRSCSTAISYLKRASERGEWTALLRDAFNSFLDDDLDSSVLLYTTAASVGYERGVVNAAWITHTKLSHNHRSRLFSDTKDRELFAENLYLKLQDSEPYLPESNLALGDICYYEHKDLKCALKRWIIASRVGEWTTDPLSRAQASYNIAWAYELCRMRPPQSSDEISFEDTCSHKDIAQFLRAEKYLDRAEQQLNLAMKDQENMKNRHYVDIAESARIAIKMARFRLYIRQHYPWIASKVPTLLLGDDRYMMEFKWELLLDVNVTSYSPFQSAVQYIFSEESLASSYPLVYPMLIIIFMIFMKAISTYIKL